jgi:Pyruvate/2-oxoacid:ferredoxin oxidoreductase delta subunit
MNGGAQASPRRRGHRMESPFIVLDRSRCEACWECITACPEVVIRKMEVWRHRHAVINAGDRCRGCGRCVKVCKAGALTERDDGNPERP